MSKGYTWDQIRSQVRSFRARTQSAFPFHALTTIKDFYFDATHDKVYFLSNIQNIDGTMSRYLTLYEVDYGSSETLTPEPPIPQQQLPSQNEHPYLTWLCKFPTAEWSPVFTKYTTASIHDDDVFSPSSSSSDLGNGDGRTLHAIQGISHYQMVGNQVLFSFNGGVYLGDVGRISSLIPYVEQQKLHDPAIFLLQSTQQSDSPPSPHNGMTIDPPSPKHQALKQQQQHAIRSDPKLGNDSLIAFIRNRDIWVVTPDGYEVQLTTCSLQNEDLTLSCGIVEYVMQEEFQRYTGYYWGPVDESSKMNRILYLETSEEQVDVVMITKSQTPSGLQSPSTLTPSLSDARSNPGSPVRYPRAGRSNAVSDMQIVYFDPIEQGHPTIVKRKRLWGGSINERYPWAEYLVRFGWLPDGQSVWAQILSRDQHRTVVLRIRCDQFVSEEEYQQDPKPTQFEVLWEEHSDIWINISDAYYFLQNTSSTSDCTEFIWSSEMSGFRHLYLIRKPHHVEFCLESSSVTVQQLTEGEWGLTDHAIDVDERRQLVYFKAKKDTPIETHLYVTCYRQRPAPPIGRQGQPPPNPITRLTELGFSHHVTMDTKADAFIDCLSSLHHTPCIVIRRIEHHFQPSEEGDGGFFMLPTVSETDLNLIIPVARRNDEMDLSNNDMGGGRRQSSSYDDSTRRLSGSTSPQQQQFVYASPTHHDRNPHNGPTEPCDSNLEYCKSEGIEYMPAIARSNTIESFDPETQTVPAGEIFSFVNDDGIRQYGYLYKPRFYQPGTSYPTILYIYGGPKTQMVTNDFRLPRLQRYMMSVYFGFAVVVIDGRGSSDRGLQFEAHLKHRLGSVEIEDQIAGLQYVCDSKLGAEPANDGTLTSVVDIHRVAINGWSYGGYLSLMGLAQRPDVFKIAIAGAPVTQWELYDSAYTERYMGTPIINPSGYQAGNVVHWAKQFPDSEHRLLIAHGLIDENVHFTNTEVLVSELVKYNKPHYLQVYPTEKHGLRHASVNEHFETLMFFWLINYL
ncbi:hypothetical protein BDA99DRAFT_565521 [Phascolomyces articulosus]|uniref:Uncharacterized protein n=1 Tax=Phascolomyces articulosus TaxID=60185 RepID=A0AAD5JYC0_9FUNG|nr:hypothetical protein BDA99DRAFT_565521 [Phascolomyces articulosus]